MSQPAMYDFITKTRSCGLLYQAVHVKYPLVISHTALTSQNPTVWDYLWDSVGASLVIFITTSYEAAYVWLPDAKYRHLLPHAPMETKLGPHWLGIQEQDVLSLLY